MKRTKQPEKRLALISKSVSAPKQSKNRKVLNEKEQPKEFEKR
jgi:hypothetical protein